ncbi:hypothetical protein SH661x_002046 [Planctomicrobium sp. SH661]|uniref:HEAT repeat domain-containing protein n=1 Tax=Planctomicrobium sp. SH661 TaxID=3448124 RepID=UPI003F5C6BD2
MFNSAKFSLAIIALWTLQVSAQAGLFCRPSNCDASKGCDCAPNFQPQTCRPKIIRPTCFHYPIKKGCTKPDCCYDTNCTSEGCCPVVTSCAPGCTSTGCDDGCCSSTPCELAELIRKSQTACHSWERRDAVHKLSDKYSCKCHPEVMNALLFSLNDVDERVRSKAADEIGDQLRENPGCCSCTVLAALKFALADCDRFVRRQTEEALRAAGYDVVDGCGDECCVGCDASCTTLTHVPSIVPPAVDGPVTPAVEPAAAIVPATVPVNDRAPTIVPQDNFVAPPPGERPQPSSSAPEGDNYSPKPDALMPQTPGASAAEPIFTQKTKSQSIRQSLSSLFGQTK